MVKLISYQLEQSLFNVKSARRVVGNRLDIMGSDLLDDYHTGLLDIEILLEDIIGKLDDIEDCF